jgi:hypothetical protein
VLLIKLSANDSRKVVIPCFSSLSRSLPCDSEQAFKPRPVRGFFLAAARHP